MELKVIMDALGVAAIGLGFVVLPLLLSAYGILKDKYWLVIIGAILFIPFSYYLFGAGGANGFALLPLLLQMVAAAAVREKYKTWAWILLAPSFLVVMWVLAVVLVYQIRT